VSLVARLLDREREAYVFGVLRVAVGALATVHAAQRLLELARRGYFGDVFHLPILPEALVPSMPVYAVLQLVALAGGVLAVLGWHGRAGLFAHATIGLFLLLANRLEYHNNRFALLLVALLTAFTPCEKSLLFVRRRGAPRPDAERRGPVFATNLLRLTVSAVYLSSGGGKLLDPDWRGGRTMLVRFARGLEDLAERGVVLPDAVAAAYSSPWFASLASKSAIALELALAVALWLPKLRPLALYAGALFHLNIELSARVELFSYVMAAAYVAFAIPEIRERAVVLDPRSRVGRFVERALPWVDWLARFRVEARAGARFAVLDRAGQRHEGLASLAALSRAIPALFPLWVPLALGAKIRGR
jgi:hypothetical protein